MNHELLLTVLIGSIAGLFGGALGQSGAEVMVPGLLILGVVPNFKTAAGTVLLAILPPISILAVLQYYERHQVKVWTSVTLFVCYFFLAFVGAYFTKDVSNRVLEFVTGFYFLIISAFFFWNAYTGTFGESQDGKKTIPHLANGFKNLFSKG
jgi:uncharacterized membrane protein YfcA